MRRHWKRKMWMIPLVMIGIAALTGLVIMSLWNWIMPGVFGLGLITFWQAIGLFILGKLLFGGVRKRRHWGMNRHHYRHAYCYANKHNTVRDEMQ